eukprot:XP_001697126.1 predicted protein [Chlamydomonas reinhardtii]
MSLSVDDLLKELDDLPGKGQGALRMSASAAHHHGRSGSTPPPVQPLNSRVSVPVPPRGSAGGSSQSLNSQPGHGRTRSVSGTTSKKDDLDNLLGELDFGGTPYNSMNGRQGASALGTVTAAAAKLSSTTSTGTPPPPSRGSSVIASKQKCTGVFTGGTSFPRGRMGAVGALTCCDALRCTKCDFRVEQFNNREWHADVDYLFFRNNFPNEEKLAPKMRSRQGSVAYCCQCSWLNSTEQAKLDFSSELRWVCAGHLMP